MEEPWTVGNIENLKFLGSSTDSEHDCFKPIHFEDCFSLFTGMKVPHFLLQYIQFSRSQTTTNETSMLRRSRNHFAGKQILLFRGEGMWRRELPICCIN